MERLKEIAMNSLLVLMVALSVGLSARVWFPAEPVSQTRVQGPSIQAAPPTSQEGIMPDVFRPERIYVRPKDGTIALLPAGSVPYKRLWRGLQDTLGGMTAVTANGRMEEEPDQEAVATITLVMPLSLTVEQWAEYWKWDTSGLRNFTQKVDRLTLVIGKNAVIQLSGPTGATLRLGFLADVDLKNLNEIVAGLEPDLFSKYRPLTLPESTLRISPGLLVPDVAEMPVATLNVKKPDYNLEVARYFPDLSVLRQMDEKEARNFTDGQRLLRITEGGQIDYLIAHTPGIAPELPRARATAKDWVGSHGGWPQDLVMNWYMHQPGITILMFDLRMDGPFPVESVGTWGSQDDSSSPRSGGAVRLEITMNRDPGEEPYSTVTKYRRFPELTPVFGRGRRPVISAERALQQVASQFAPQLLFEEVREMHLAYLVRHIAKVGTETWALEPVWVIQVGDERIYTPASTTSDLAPFVARP